MTNIFAQHYGKIAVVTTITVLVILNVVKFDLARTLPLANPAYFLPQPVTVKQSPNFVAPIPAQTFQQPITQTNSQECRSMSSLVKTGVDMSKNYIVDSNTVSKITQMTLETCKDLRLPSRGPPVMNNDDQKLFKKVLKSVKEATKPCMTYVEWGSGGSTYWALQTADRVLSIENHAEWCNIMLQDKEVQCNILSGKLVYVCSNGGPTVKWGQPADPKKYDSRYYIDVLKSFDVEPDFVLIDGRYRVATAISSMKWSKPDSTLMIHDYHNRPHYHKVEKYLKLQNSNSTPAVFGVFKKKKFDLTELNEFLFKFRADPH